MERGRAAKRAAKRGRGKMELQPAFSNRPRDIPQVNRRVRPPSLSSNSDLADGDWRAISTEEISFAPCAVGEETPLEEGSFPVAFGK